MRKQVAELEAQVEKEKASLAALHTEVKKLKADHVKQEEACARSQKNETVCKDRATQWHREYNHCSATIPLLHQKLEAHREEDAQTCSPRSPQRAKSPQRAFSENDFANYFLRLGDTLLREPENHTTTESGEALFQQHPGLAMWEMNSVRAHRERLEKTCQAEQSEIENYWNERHMESLLDLSKEFQDENKEYRMLESRCQQLRERIARHGDAKKEHYKVAHQHLEQREHVRNRNVFLTAELEEYAADMRKHKTKYWEVTHLRHLSVSSCSHLQKQGYNDEGEILRLTSILREVDWEANEAAEEARNNDAISELAARSLGRPDNSFDTFDGDTSLAPLLFQKTRPITAKSIGRRSRRRSSIVRAWHPCDEPPSHRQHWFIEAGMSPTSNLLPPLPPPPNGDIEAPEYSRETQESILLHDADSELREIGREADMLAEVFEVEVVNSSLATEVAHMREKVEQHVLRSEIEIAHMRERAEQRMLQEEIRVMRETSAVGDQTTSVPPREHTDSRNDLWEEQVAEVREHEEQQCLLAEILDLRRRAVERRVAHRKHPDLSFGGATSPQANLNTYREDVHARTLQNGTEKLSWQHGSDTLPTAPLTYGRLPTVPLQHEGFRTMFETPQPLTVWQHGKLPAPPMEVWAAA